MKKFLVVLVLAVSLFALAIGVGLRASREAQASENLGLWGVYCHSGGEIVRSWKTNFEPSRNSGGFTFTISNSDGKRRVVKTSGNCFIESALR